MARGSYGKCDMAVSTASIGRDRGFRPPVAGLPCKGSVQRVPERKAADGVVNYCYFHYGLLLTREETNLPPPVRTPRLRSREIRRPAMEIHCRPLRWSSA